VQDGPLGSGDVRGGGESALRLYELFGLDAKGLGELADRAPARLNLVTLDADNGGDPHTRALGELLLSQQPALP
jgi:hypothetical protein